MNPRGLLDMGLLMDTEAGQWMTLVSGMCFQPSRLPPGFQGTLQNKVLETLPEESAFTAKRDGDTGEENKKTKKLVHIVVLISPMST